MIRIAFLIAFVILAVGNSARAEITFDFTNNGLFDNSQANDSEIVGGVTMTLIGFEYWDLSSVSIESPNPSNFLTGQSVGFQGDGTAFGVDNSTITGSSYSDVYGPGNEQNRFNFGEAMVFSFDKDVRFNTLDFQGISTATESFTISFNGNSETFFTTDLNGQDEAVNPFGTMVIDADTEIRLSYDGVAGLRNAQGTIVTTGDVGGLQAFVLTAVPEPSSFLLLGACLLPIASRHRRRG